VAALVEFAPCEAQTTGSGQNVGRRSMHSLPADPSASKRHQVFLTASLTPGKLQVAWTSHPYDALFTWKFSQNSKATEKDRRRWNQRCLSIRSYGKPTQTNRYARLRRKATKIPP